MCKSGHYVWICELFLVLLTITIFVLVGITTTEGSDMYLNNYTLLFLVFLCIILVLMSFPHPFFLSSPPSVISLLLPCAVHFVSKGNKGTNSHKTHMSTYTEHSNTITLGCWILENHPNLLTSQSCKKRGRFPCYIKGEVVASVPASPHLSAVYSNHTEAVSSSAFILLYFPSLCFVFRLTVTGFLLPQGNRVMSLMSFHSQLYIVAPVCVRQWQGSRRGLLESMCLCSSLTVAQSKLISCKSVCCLQIVSFVVVFWLDSSRMLLSCWPPLRPVTHYWKCCNHTVSAGQFSPHGRYHPQTLKHHVQRHALNVTSERSDHFLLEGILCVSAVLKWVLEVCLICVIVRCFFGQTFLDKSDVLLLPRGWVFSASSPNKASLCPCWVREFQGRLPPQLP